MNYITAAQKAKELGISRATLSRRVKAGLITPAFTADNGNQYFHPEAK